MLTSIAGKIDGATWGVAGGQGEKSEGDVWCQWCGRECRLYVGEDSWVGERGVWQQANGDRWSGHRQLRTGG